MNDSQERLWVLIDAAGLENGRAEIDESVFGAFRCLFTGDLEIELADCAPYLGLLDPRVNDLRTALKHLVTMDCVVILADSSPELTFSQVHRHFRKFNVVYGPEGTPLFFRYYDGRVLSSVLEVLDAEQVKTFFGPFDSIFVSGEEGRTTELGLVDGRLTRRVVDVPLHSVNGPMA